MTQGKQTTLFKPTTDMLISASLVTAVLFFYPDGRSTSKIGHAQIASNTFTESDSLKIEELTQAESANIDSSIDMGSKQEKTFQDNEEASEVLVKREELPSDLSEQISSEDGELPQELNEQLTQQQEPIPEDIRNALRNMQVEEEI